MSNPSLSLIIPVLCDTPQKEARLKTCLQSIQKQKLKSGTEFSIEVIVVDDSSPPSYSENIKSLLKDLQEHNITSFKLTTQYIRHTHNKGPGIARNSGTQVATGRYVWYVDSDDIISPNAVSVLMNAANQHNFPDIIHFNARAKRLSRTRSRTKPASLYSGIENAPENGVTKYLCDTKVLARVLESFFVYSTLKVVFALKVAREAHFNRGVIYEDILHSIHTHLLARNALILPDTLYHYTQNQQGLSANAPLVLRCITLYKRYLGLQELYRQQPSNLEKSWRTLMTKLLIRIVNQQFKCGPLPELLTFWNQARASDHARSTEVFQAASINSQTLRWQTRRILPAIKHSFRFILMRRNPKLAHSVYRFGRRHQKR